MHPLRRMGNSLTDELRRGGFPRRFKTLVLGLGRTGLSCARFLSSRGEEVAVADSRMNPPGRSALQAELPNLGLFLGPFDVEVLASAQQLVVSPGVSIHEPAIVAARRRGIPVLGDVELFAHYAHGPVVAITGSNGKSTVTTLLGSMVKRAGRDVRIGGNLGTPALDLLSADPAELYVLELSSFQLETTESLCPVAAAVLNLSPDHMDRYPNLAAYRAAKERIYRCCEVAVVNGDDPRVLAMVPPTRRVLYFRLGEPQGAHYGVRSGAGQEWLARGERLLLPVDDLRIVGRHNVANALAALALGTASGLPMEPMLDALRVFPGLAHRTQWAGERDGVVWYNDSKATNVGATVAALQGMRAKVVLIAGGQGKGADFSALRSVAKEKVRAVVVMGRDGPRLGQTLTDLVPVVAALDMDEAVVRAGELALAGDAVMLSPACSSFDMYASFEERGEAFMRAVRECLG
jgi:UDP-N-acetylmuramoylalanine--D-glutamate ligase